MKNQDAKRINDLIAMGMPGKNSNISNDTIIRHSREYVLECLYEQSCNLLKALLEPSRLIDFWKSQFDVLHIKKVMLPYQFYTCLILGNLDVVLKSRWRYVHLFQSHTLLKKKWKITFKNLETYAKMSWTHTALCYKDSYIWIFQISLVLRLSKYIGWLEMEMHWLRYRSIKGSFIND